MFGQRRRRRRALAALMASGPPPLPCPWCDAPMIGVATGARELDAEVGDGVEVGFSMLCPSCGRSSLAGFRAVRNPDGSTPTVPLPTCPQCGGEHCTVELRRDATGMGNEPDALGPRWPWITCADCLLDERCEVEL